MIWARETQRLLLVYIPSVLLAFALSCTCGGVQAQGNFGYGVDVQVWGQDPEPVINGVVGMGFDWLRQTVKWADVEPIEGNYNWGPLDALIAAAEPFRIQVLVAVSGAPDWAVIGRGGGTVSVRTDAFAAFLGEMAGRYLGRIGAYEIWPGMNRADGEGMTPADYATLLQTAYVALKASDPMCLVVSGGLAPVSMESGVGGMDDVTYLGELYQVGGRQWFDVLGVHLNGYDNPPESVPGAQGTGRYSDRPQYFFRHYEDIRRVMVEQGDAETQIWLTLVGWAASADGVVGYVTEEQQADYLVRAFGMASHEPFIGLMVVNNFNYATQAQAGDIISAFSLLRPDWTARPAFLALARMRQSVRMWEDAPVSAERHSADAMPNVPD